MFARTKRLTLRPVWPEDAPAVAAAIGHQSVARMLMRVPYPYGLADAEAFVARARAPHDPRFVIVAHDRPAPTIVGGIAIQEEPEGHHLAYWLTPDAWGRGYATEAGRAVIAMARYALPIRELRAWHFADNAASGRVLAKLGFRRTGEIAAKTSGGREGVTPSVEYALDLEGEQSAPMPIAA
ncbi:GNAT family N-acetyltransferase [Sphingomonas sp.]|jgi:RimJ/RimL family protein N-acetyltransferase|uniref:GNAT family N-acetyltransferase n=1 Tax=Sphingomonas sp. TaxID=28214 RepID=UPI002EDAC52F